MEQRQRPLPMRPSSADARALQPDSVSAVACLPACPYLRRLKNVVMLAHTANDSSRSREASEESNAELTEGDGGLAGEDTDTGSFTAPPKRGGSGSTVRAGAGINAAAAAAASSGGADDQSVFVHPASVGAHRKTSPMHVDAANLPTSSGAAAAATSREIDLGDESTASAFLATPS